MRTQGWCPYSNLVAKFKNSQQTSASGPRREPPKHSRPPSPSPVLRQTPLSHLPTDFFGNRFPAMVGQMGKSAGNIMPHWQERRVGRSFQSETLTHGLLWFTRDCHQESFNRPARKWEVLQLSCLCNMILEEINRESWYVCGTRVCICVHRNKRSSGSRWVCNKKVSKWMNHHQNSHEHDPGPFL